MSSKLSRLMRRVLKNKRQARDRAVRQIKTTECVVRVADGDGELFFRCRNPTERRRVDTLETKETGTVDWLRNEVRQGDVVYDIGANVGIYSLIAARRVGDTGRVYSFEPHIQNAASAMVNVRLNQLESRITLVTAALHKETTFCDFNYHNDCPGSSQSQLLETRDDQGREYTPVFRELKSATTIDALIRGEQILPANLIKLDVDGNEASVLQGMRKLLAGDQRPRLLQVEISPRNKSIVFPFLEECGYRFELRHDTATGKQKLADVSTDPDTICHNAIFRPRMAKQQSTKQAPLRHSLC